MLTRAIFCVLVLSAPGLAQVEVDAARLPAELRDLSKRAGETSLKCEVQPIRPALNFSFRFQAGFVVRVPLGQFVGKGHHWLTVMRVTPQDGSNKPVYLLNGFRLPEVPPTKSVAEFGGGYQLGEGRYQVEWVMLDDRDRVCRKTWTVDAELRGKEKKVKPGLPAYAVRGQYVRRFSSPRPTEARTSALERNDDVRPFRITILMHAASLNPRASKIRAFERVVLLGLLSSLVEQIPARSVRVVMFNLDQQKELLRRDSFTAETISEAAQAMNTLELGLVDYKILQNQQGHLNLLADLINRELSAKEQSDAVIFLGPPSRIWEKFPGSALAQRSGPGPAFYYFQYRPFLRYAADPPDLIQSATSEMKGKTVKIQNPGDFAKAIEQLGNQITGDR
jgi:hypothetical protein